MNPWQQLGVLGRMPSVVRCDECGKRISLEGITLKTITQGEYQTSYFSCVHCGASYQITTTDPLQRQLITEYKRIPEKIRLARERKFRPETIRQYERRRDALEKKIRGRVAGLREIGERMLNDSGGGDDET